MPQVSQVSWVYMTSLSVLLFSFFFFSFFFYLSSICFKFYFNYPPYVYKVLI